MIFDFCEHFQGATPFSVRRERARDFFEIFLALAKRIRKQSKQKNKPQVIRKPAGDNWF